MKQSLALASIVTASLVAAPVYANSSTSEAFGKNVVNMNITEAEVESIQKAWGQALIQIGKDFDRGGRKAATKTAEQVLKTAYGYDLGTVLFKPTLTHGEQTFRTTREGALAYFVGGNNRFPNDAGFALKGWQKYEFKNAGVFINGNMAITMGNVYLTDKSGNVTKVDKTWGFQKNSQGQLKIVLHHSSLPYTPPTPDKVATK